MSSVTPPLKAEPDWLNELGPVVEGLPEWRRPKLQCFEGRYCRLEPLSLEDHADDLWAQMAVADPDMRQWMFLAGLGPFEDQAAFVAAWRQFADAVDNLTYVVIPTDPVCGLPNVATGQFSFLRLRPAAGSIEVGFVRFPPQMARTRVSTEAQYLLMAHVFDDLRYRRYEWKCNADNQPSMRTAARLGFTYEGTFRQDMINHGRNRDTAWWSIIDSEWPALKKGYAAWLAPSNFDADGRQHRRLADLIAEHQ